MASRTGHKPVARGGWVKMTSAEIIAFSDESKQAIKRRVDETIARHMKPALFKRHGKQPAFGDVYDVYTKWRGPDLILIAQRRGGRLNNTRVEDFETKSSRLTLVGVNAFDRLWCMNRTKGESSPTLGWRQSWLAQVTR